MAELDPRNNIDALNAYREKAILWLDEQLAEFGPNVWSQLPQDEQLALGRKWQAHKCDFGYGGIGWPEQYGCAGGTELQKLVFNQEEIKRGFPTVFFGVSLGMPIPLLLAIGSEQDKIRFIKPAVRGDEIWCQLFSEPSAGSDVAALRTKAIRAPNDPESWIVNGQKLWTSWAQYSDYGIMPVRTDADVPKHKGLTFFWVDLKAPGVTVRPVRLMDGSHDVNEVFFDNVRIPDNQRLGEVGGGFAVIMQTLMIERYHVADEAGFGPPLSAFIDLLGSQSYDEGNLLYDARHRKILAEHFALQSGLAAIQGKALLEASLGHPPGPEGSLFKLVSMRARQSLAAHVLDMQGMEGMLRVKNGRVPDDFGQSWLAAPSQRIAGGTDEILLNSIAEHILGLPQDARPGKGKTFREMNEAR